MIFSTLWESSKKGELLLVDGGLCHWHFRRDGQITIREIISQRKGVGSQMLDYLKDRAENLGATSLFATCPADLESNLWYEKRGFILESVGKSRTGKKLNYWRLCL